MIVDTKRNIFGGFTPMEWASRDDSLESFVFMLKNPRNVLARRCVLKAEMKHQANSSNSEVGPDFRDVGVPDNCTANPSSYTCLGFVYNKNTVYRVCC
jgi:hypothetical protein